MLIKRPKDNKRGSSGQSVYVVRLSCVCNIESDKNEYERKLPELDGVTMQIRYCVNGPSLDISSSRYSIMILTMSPAVVLHSNCLCLFFGRITVIQLHYTWDMIEALQFLHKNELDI